MLSRPQLVEYYSDERIAKLILEGAKNREVAGAFWDGSYDKRPNILQYPTDIVQMVRKGVTSFHLSVEHWSNPMAITSENYEKLRTGWDMIIDIDSKLGVDESKIAAKLIVKLLGKYGIRQPGVKFSGRRGFHICVPFGLFPKEIDYKPLAKMYPDALRILASFIRYKIRKKLLDELIKSKGGVGHLVEALGEAPGKLSPFHFVEIERMGKQAHVPGTLQLQRENVACFSTRASYQLVLTQRCGVRQCSEFSKIRGARFLRRERRCDRSAHGCNGLVCSQEEGAC